MKLQEIFDAASVHLMGMDGPSLDTFNDACAYRGEDHGEFNGQKCAVGLFIADEHYDPELEGLGIASTGGGPVADAVAKSWDQDDLTEAQVLLLSDLQDAHDDSSRVGEWPNSVIASLDKVATKFHLRFDPKGASA